MSVSVAPFQGTAAEWDAFGAAQLGWTAYHRFAWRSLLEETYGHECPFLAARDASGTLAGLLPLARVRSRLFGHFLVSMPFVSYGGPVGSDAAVVALTDHAKSMATAEGADLLELRSARELPVSLPVSHRKLTVVLDLAGGASAVLKRLKPKLRSQTKRSSKEGVTFEFGSDRVRDFHAVFARHMRDLGTPAQPLAFFQGIADRLGDDAWFGCAYLNGIPITCGAGLRWGAEFEITWASSLREWNSISPNIGLYWAFIERAANAGLSRFNFGRCTPDSNTHRFKLQWGAVDEPLWWYQHSAKDDAALPNQHSAKFAFAARVWRRLPVRLTTALGPRIVRYLP